MSQDPNRESPYTGYGPTSQNPYEQNPYATPPPQNPYDPSVPYSGSPPPDQQGYGYGPPYQPYQTGYEPPQPAPLPLNEAIRQLPNQYVKVLTKPSAATFGEEMGKASWDIIWVQLIGYSVILAILGFLRSFTNPTLFGSPTGTSAANAAAVQALIGSINLGLIFTTPIIFFISVGIYYLIAKAFGGQGTFKVQSYTQLLYQVPIGIVSSILFLVPYIGVLGSFLGIYSIVLEVLSIMAVHRLSGGKATAVVLIPIALAIVLACGIIAIIITLLAVAARNIH
jgi:hypothetical protein